jgi:uncharacterized protein YqeY
MLKQQLEEDLKTALLAGEKDKATTLRGLKSAILYAEVEQGKRDDGLDDDGITAVLTKEAKKRQESADLYAQGGNKEQSEKELSEKAIIEHYLPEQLSDEKVRDIVNSSIKELGTVTVKDMGKVIGVVKGKTKNLADGATIARIVREELAEK